MSKFVVIEYYPRKQLHWYLLIILNHNLSATNIQHFYITWPFKQLKFILIQKNKMNETNIYLMIYHMLCISFLNNKIIRHPYKIRTSVYHDSKKFH